MKKLFINWNLYEISLLTIGISCVFLSGFLCKSSILTIMVSFLTIFCAIFQAKGKSISQIIGLIQCLLYSYLSYNNRYYGEAIINIFLLFPLYINGVISWLKNTDKETDTVIKNKITKKEWTILFVLSLILSVSLYFLLRYFKTDKLFVSTISMVFSLFATYLVSRRSKYGFIFYIMNDFVLIVLWGSLTLFNDISLFPMLIMPIVLFLNDIYGFKIWNKETEEV